MEVITNILLFLSVAWLLERLCLVASSGVSAIKSRLDNFDQRLATGVRNIGPLWYGNKAWEVQIGNSVLQLWLWYQKILPESVRGMEFGRLYVWRCVPQFYYRPICAAWSLPGTFFSRHPLRQDSADRSVRRSK